MHSVLSGFRAVPIIGLAKPIWQFLPISASVQNSTRTDIATDIYTAIVCKQTDYNIGFLRYQCGCSVTVAYCSLDSRRYATRSHTNTRDSSVCCWKAYQS